MSHFANELGKRLEQVMASPRLTGPPENWGNAAVMSRALARVERYFTSRDEMRGSDPQPVAEAVLRFRKFSEIRDYRDTKYICIGASQDFSGWSLLQDQGLLEILLQRSSLGSDRQRFKYFGCLLSSYWSFPRDAKETPASSTTGWVRLREWLSAQRLYLDQSIKAKPLWFSTLNEHANLLAEQPCKRYGQELLQGMSASLNAALENLGVGSDSWLRNEVIYAQMQAGVELGDMQFQSCLARLTDAASGRSELRLSRSISIRCLALLVSRYAVCAGTPEHIPLRDAAIAFIGNPWLHRAAWDAYVLDKSGRPDDRAREMVNGWLKVRLIKDFFDLLSEDRSADGRRLNYWLGFEPMIRDMWFALGADALSDPRREYVEFRQRANGRLLQLVGGTPTSNNAFLMQIGEYLVIEFGIANNACFVYRYDRLPPRIKVRLSGANAGAVVDIAELKARGREARLLHHGSWEPNFDAALCPLLGFTHAGFIDLPPARRTSPMKNSSDQGVHDQGHAAATRKRSFSRLEFEGFRSTHGLAVEDLGAKGGCLWVRTDAANPQINERLKSWGFAYRPAMGWWKE